MESYLLGESKSAAKRRARRWGVCYCHGRLERANKQTNAQVEVERALRGPATRYQSKVGQCYVTNAIQHCLDDMHKRGDHTFDNKFKINGPAYGSKSPEETPWAYNWTNT
ncbi:nucleic acid-binding protein [Blackberry virus A]|uniref:Nucleic acid-binding protein n=1 Tax=Blackberry virus A TaxID=2185086 RepID=A0A2S1YE89_9VIRU|nr:nucleic acid-binding protein [Blackberry virus A]AWK02343.1 nucleic acid-binding protein [Blackberry virus A]